MHFKIFICFIVLSFSRYGIAQILPWSPAVTVKDRTLEVLNTYGNLNSGFNWYSGSLGGSPGKAYSPCLEKEIVFSEVNYNSSPTMDAGDWVELHNIFDDTIDVSGWGFNGGNISDNFYFPNNTLLKPNEYLVVVYDSVKFKSQHPEVNNFVGSFNFDLSADGQTIQLINLKGIVYLSLSYEHSDPWPEEANGLNKTLELLDPNGDLNSGENWFAGCPGGSPGTEYITTCNTAESYEDFPDNLRVKINPNPSNNSIGIQLFSNLDEPIFISILDVFGREIRTINLTGANETILDRKDYGTGIFILKITDHNKNVLLTRRIVFQ